MANREDARRGMCPADAYIRTHAHAYIAYAPLLPALYLIWGSITVLIQRDKIRMRGLAYSYVGFAGVHMNHSHVYANRH